MAKLYYKAIPLLPTKFDLDVFVCKNHRMLADKAAEIMGKDYLFWEEHIGLHPCVLSYDSAKQKHICMFLPDFKPAVIVHEAVHVSWYLDKKVGFNYSYKAQETQAYLVEYIFEEILKMKKQWKK